MVSTANGAVSLALVLSWPTYVTMLINAGPLFFSALFPTLSAIDEGGSRLFHLFPLDSRQPLIKRVCGQFRMCRLIVTESKRVVVQSFSAAGLSGIAPPLTSRS